MLQHTLLTLVSISLLGSLEKLRVTNWWSSCSPSSFGASGISSKTSSTSSTSRWPPGENWCAISSNVLFFVSGTKKYVKTVKPVRRTTKITNVYCWAAFCNNQQTNKKELNKIPF